MWNKYLKAGCLVLIVTALAHSVPAQDRPGTPGTPAANDQRIGIDPLKVVRMTLREAIGLALENNRDIEVDRLSVQLNEFDLRASQGAYDPILNASVYYDRRLVPATSFFASGKTDNVIGNARLTQRTPWQGGSYEVLFDNNRSTTANPFNVLNPQYQTTLSFNYVQPLWRNRSIDSSRRQIKITKKRLDISDSQFRQRAIEIIAQVQRAYWDLVFARRDRDIKREAVELARTQLDSNQRRVEAGNLAPADVISARVEVERRTDEAEAALEAIQRAENALKNLMLEPGKAELWRSTIEPTEAPEVDKSASIPLPDAVKLAFRSRPELEQYRLRSDLNGIDADYFRNQTKPQIDFFMTYGTVGLAGFPRPDPNPITAGNVALYARVNQLSAIAGLPPLPPPAIDGGLNPSLIGGYGQSLQNLLRNEFRAWRVGVNFNLPLRNRTAEAQYGRALAEGRQIDVQRQKMEQQIEVEVRNALQSVDTSKRRVEAAKNSRVNAELQYESEVRKFDAGQSTNFLVLDRQNAMSSARGRELKALTDYTKAVAELQRSVSTTLASNSIQLKGATSN
jgi:outer membrane protein